MEPQIHFPDTQQIEVFPFSRQKGGEEWIIGREEHTSYLALPGEALEVLDDLASGHTVGQARNLYRERHGETPDLDDFLQNLVTRGFVRRLGEKEPDILHPEPEPKNYHFENFPLGIARSLFAPQTLLLYGFVVLTAGIFAWNDPTILPNRGALLFERFQAPKLVLVISLSLVTLFVHEMAHLIAARAVGVKARLGVGNRLWVLVAETDLSGLWAIPKEKRYLPLIAGPIIDLFCSSLLFLILAIAHHGEFLFSPFTMEILRALLFAYFIQIVWQFFFFVRTDFYYVFATAFDCKNLLGDTEMLLKNQLARWTSRIVPTDLSHIPRREMRIIRIYSLIWILGRVVAFTILFTITLPLAIDYFVKILDAFNQGSRADPLAFVDALMMSALFLGAWLLGLTLWLRNTNLSWRISS